MPGFIQFQGNCMVLSRLEIVFTSKAAPGSISEPERLDRDSKQGATMITKRQFSLGLCATGLTSLVPGAWQSAQSQAGTRGARIMVGFGPGGSLDVAARLLTTAMKDYA